MMSSLNVLPKREGAGICRLGNIETTETTKEVNYEGNACIILVLFFIISFHKPDHTVGPRFYAPLPS